MLKHDPVAHWTFIADPTPWVIPSFVSAARGVPAVPQQVSVVWPQTPAVQKSVVQILLSLQFTGVPTQALFAQTSFVVQRLLSLHGSVFAVNTQVPIVGEFDVHVSVVQALLSLHTFGVPTQVPAAVHLSSVVQPLPSLQVVPVRGVCVQMPVA
jgi:hypothetical protein